MLDSQGLRPDFWCSLGLGVKHENLMGQDLDRGGRCKYRQLCRVTAPVERFHCTCIVYFILPITINDSVATLLAINCVAKCTTIGDDTSEACKTQQ